MSKNPWNLPRFESHIGTEETASVEFKSSRGLMEPKERFKAVESICQDVSGFLNGDGGVILMGLDEGQRQQRPDTATGLSTGVPRSILNASRSESMICDQIHPSVAGLVKLFPITVGGSSENPLLAYLLKFDPASQPIRHRIRNTTFAVAISPKRWKIKTYD